MLCVSSSFPLLGTTSAITTIPSSKASNFVVRTTLRYDYGCSWTGIDKKMTSVRVKTGYPLVWSQLTKDSPRPKTYKEVTKSAREMFAKETCIESKDCQISIAKALLYIAAEDEAFLAYNRERDARSLMKERKNVPTETDQSDAVETGELSPSKKDQSDRSELLQLDGKSITEWLSELDNISKEVEAELVSRDIGCHLAQVLDAVNAVLFDWRGFKRATTIALDPECFYLHSVLNHRCSTAFLLSVIYIEVCTRLGVSIVGSRVGEDFLIWPKLDYPEELFKVTSGKSLFSIVNGNCVDDPATMASDLTAKSLEGLEIATNRDIIGIALANLVRLHWRRATKSSPGLMLTSPLSQLNNISSSNTRLVRPQELRLAIAALERLLIMYPHKWQLRRDLGMMLYYARQYGEAIQELSICMAFLGDEEEVRMLELFVEKLHLLRLLSSLKSPVDTGRLTVP